MSDGKKLGGYVGVVGMGKKELRIGVRGQICGYVRGVGRS